LRATRDHLQQSGAVGICTDETDAELDATAGEGTAELSSGANEGATAPADGRRRVMELGLGADDGTAVTDAGTGELYLL
jgi:hypothetical protein